MEHWEHTQNGDCGEAGLLSLADDPVHSYLGARLSAVSRAYVPHQAEQWLDLLDSVVIK